MINIATRDNACEVANLAIQMWEDNSIEGLTEEFIELIEKEDAQIFIKFVQDKAVGFAQCQLRYDYVEGTESSPVGYLEGIFLEKEYRGKGYATECLNYAKRIAQNENAYKMMLLTGSKKESTLNFYKNAGYNSTDKQAFVQWL